MIDKSLAFHESLDTHELLNLKTIGLLKAKFIQGIVFDEDLRKLLEKSVEQTIQDIKELQDLYIEAKLQ